MSFQHAGYTNPQGFHKKREEKGVPKNKRMGSNPLLPLVTSSRFPTELSAGSLGCHEQTSPGCIPCRQQNTAGKGSTCTKIPSKERDPTQEWELEHKGKGTDAAGDDSSSRTGSEPKGCSSWDSTVPIVPEPAQPWPGSQGCLRIPEAPPACIPAHGCYLGE